MPDNQRRPNALEKYNVRANIAANVSKNLDIDASLGFVSSNTRFVENDNSFLTVNGSGTASGNLPDVNRGWFFIPAELFAELANQAANRFTGGFTGNWRPLNWLSARATIGYDVVNRTDVQFFPTGEVADYGANRAGVRIDNRFDISQTSVDLGATARFQLSEAVGSRTSVGGQFFRDLARGNFATGRGLPAGSGSIAGAGSTEARDTLVESRSIGSYVEEEINLKQRLFLTGAVRFDDNSAFGKNFNATAYPKASASWLVSDEPFFHVSALNTLRLRAAFGASGQQPGTTDALRFFNPIAGKKDGIGTTGISFASLGNANLKPERSREFEIGLDAGLFKDRVSVEITYYNKLTKDALISRDIAPSLGGGQSQFVNLSRIRNRGFELAIIKPHHRYAQHGMGRHTERLYNAQQDSRAGPRGEPDLRRVLPAAPCGVSRRRVLGADRLVQRRQRRRHHRPHRGEPQRQCRLPRSGSADPRGLAQQRPRDLRREGRARHSVRLPRRAPGRQLARAVPLLLGRELPR